MPVSLSDSPLGLKREGWAPASSLHGLEQGAQERPRGLGALWRAGSDVFLLWQGGGREGRWTSAWDTKVTRGREWPSPSDMKPHEDFGSQGASEPRAQVSCGVEENGDVGTVRSLTIKTGSPLSWRPGPAAWPQSIDSSNTSSTAARPESMLPSSFLQHTSLLYLLSPCPPPPTAA